MVTANKGAARGHGPELEAAARATGAALRFEASVGGGILVLSPMASDLAPTGSWRSGIVNRTTNLILSAMAREGRSYADVLAEAQAQGYAEADPGADIEGHDAAENGDPAAAGVRRVDGSVGGGAHAIARRPR